MKCATFGGPEVLDATSTAACPEQVSQPIEAGRELARAATDDARRRSCCDTRRRVASSTASPPEVSPLSLVSVLTQSPTLPTRSALESAARELLPGVALDYREADGALTLGLSGATVRLKAIPGPVPNAEADTSAFLSLSSVNGRWRLGRHAAHLALSLDGAMQAKADGLFGRLSGATREATRLERLSAYTRLVAAVTKSVGGLGVHWGAAPVTHAPDFFCELAKEAPLPLPLWVGVSVTPEPGGRSTLLSFGMAQLGLPDLLVDAASKELEDAVDFFFSALATAAEAGRAPAEGETIPRSLLSRPKVRYGPSPVDAASRVWKLAL